MVRRLSPDFTEVEVVVAFSDQEFRDATALLLARAQRRALGVELFRHHLQRRFGRLQVFVTQTRTLTLCKPRDTVK